MKNVITRIRVAKDKHLEQPKNLRGGGHDTPTMVMKE
jgi:hypothetical protein